MGGGAGGCGPRCEESGRGHRLQLEETQHEGARDQCEHPVKERVCGQDRSRRDGVGSDLEGGVDQGGHPPTRVEVAAARQAHRQPGRQTWRSWFHGAATTGLPRGGTLRVAVAAVLEGHRTLGCRPKGGHGQVHLAPEELLDLPIHEGAEVPPEGDLRPGLHLQPTPSQPQGRHPVPGERPDPALGVSAQKTQGDLDEPVVGEDQGHPVGGRPQGAVGRPIQEAAELEALGEGQHLLIGPRDLGEDTLNRTGDPPLVVGVGVVNAQHRADRRRTLRILLTPVGCGRVDHVHVPAAPSRSRATV